MRRGKSPGPLAIRVSDLLFWHDKLPNIWNELVSLVQDVFDGKAIPQEFSYEILCLILKEDRGKYCHVQVGLNDHTPLFTSCH